MMLHRNAATAAASRASGQAADADLHRSVAMVIIALLLPITTTRPLTAWARSWRRTPTPVPALLGWQRVVKGAQDVLKVRR